MSCAFNTLGVLSPVDAVIYIYPASGGSELARAGKTSLLQASYANVIAAFSDNFLAVQSEDGPVAVNKAYIIMLSPSSSGATLLLRGGARLEVSDIYANMAPALSKFLFFTDSLGPKGINWADISLVAESRSGGAKIVMLSGKAFSPVESYADIVALAESCASSPGAMAPENVVPPSISGGTTFGSMLTAQPGSYLGQPMVTGQWRRAGAVISGETGLTYTLALADSGQDIDYYETAVNSGGSANTASNIITADAFSLPAIDGAPTVTGTEEVGQTLTATAAAVSGSPAPTVELQWQKSADGMSGWADIAGETSASYEIAGADEGAYIRVKQTASNTVGSDEAFSAPTGAIAAAQPAAPFVIRVNTETTDAFSSNNDQFAFTGAQGNYDVEVYDTTGVTLLETIAGLSGAATVTIAAGPGIYQLKVIPALTSGFDRIKFSSGGDSGKITHVLEWGDFVWGNMDFAFNGCLNLVSIASSTPINLGGATTIQAMCLDCTSLESADFSGMLAPGVTTMENMFEDCPVLTSVGFLNVTMPVLTRADFAFRFCAALTSVDLTGFPSSLVTNMRGMFEECVLLTDIIGIDDWAIANVLNFNNFLLGVTLPTARYTDLLIKYEAQEPQFEVLFHGGSSLFLAGAAAARQSLISTYLWQITDG